MATGASVHLVALVRRISAAYIVHTNPRAMLLTGSAAAGIRDYFFDLDLIADYVHLLAEDQLAAARARIRATNNRVTVGREDGTSIIEEFTLDGVECQSGHFTVAWWERKMASVLEECTTATLTEKAIMGLLGGVALHGSELIGQ